MMGTLTSKGLYKPNESGEIVDVAQLNANFQRVNDYGMGPFLCTSATRPSGADRWTGQLIFETDTGRILTFNGTNWIVVTNGTWLPFTLELTAATNPVLGTGGGIEARYCVNGGVCFVRFVVTFGTTGVNPGAGAYNFSLPVPPANLLTGLPVGGSAWLRDTSASANQVASVLVASGGAQLYAHGTTAAVAATVPWTWAASDIIRAELSYEVAVSA